MPPSVQSMVRSTVVLNIRNIVSMFLKMADAHGKSITFCISSEHFVVLM